MSLPISSIASIASAARLAQGIAGGVSQALGFHEVLADDSSAGSAELLGRLAKAMRDRLADAKIDPAEVPLIRITAQGALRVEGQHPRAAEIESILNADQGVRSLAGQAAGSASADGLTLRLADANI